MRLRIIIALLIAPISLSAQLFPNLGGQRAGISGLTFLKVDVSPRSAAVGGANICLTGDAFATYTNPALLAEVENVSFGGSNTFWFSDVNYAFASGVIPLKFGTIGLSVSGLNTDAMDVRTVFQPEGTGEKFYATYGTAGISFSQELTERFTYGVSAKLVHEALATLSTTTAVVDLGFLYRTDFKDLRFAVMLQSFGPNSELSGTPDEDAGDQFGDQGDPSLEDYPAPTVFKIGISMVPWRSATGNQSLTTMVQLNHPNDNAENIRLGLEYEYKSLIFLRAGYKVNVQDQNVPTAGVGIRMRIGRHPLNFDYAFDPVRFLGAVHRIGLVFTVNPKSNSR